jgi:hypothetical protein
MLLSGTPIVFLIDEDVPQSVSEYLGNRGHITHSVKQSTFEGEPDEVIVKLAHQISQEIAAPVVVVTWNHKHFANLISRRPPNNNNRFRTLGRLSMTCPRPGAIKRLNETIEDIEREYALCLARDDKRLIVTLTESSFIIER